MKQLFNDLVRHAIAQLHASEVLLCNFCGESSDFVRFNHGRVRQAMTVRQARIEVTMIRGRTRSTLTLTLSGQSGADRTRMDQVLRSLRDDLDLLPEDPYLLFAHEARQSNRESDGQLPTPEQIIDDIVTAGHQSDLVGILASGPIHRGFANSLGAFHWHTVHAFLFDWSVYHRADKAVKSSWSGSQWAPQELSDRIQQAQQELRDLSRPARSLAPGEYRVYLAPAAVEDLVGMLNWDGISAKAQRTQQSCIQKLVSGQAGLSPMVSIAEDTAHGLDPCFDNMGFIKPPRVQLIDRGQHAGSMVSARTAAEYGIAGNGANAAEDGNSLSLAPGTLAPQDALQALGTGLAIGNLHYLNFSDQAHARITGMTRFASFWVENGKVVAPVNVMRWDDSLYRLLGDNLEALTDAPQWLMSSSTYEERSVQTMRVPGALLSSMTFTL